LIARYWDHPDWREVWPLYALAVQGEPAKLQHLFQTILASGDDLDAQLFRPQLACLGLAGLGRAPLPPVIGPVLHWAVEVLKRTAYPLFEIMHRLAAWERRLTSELRSAALARLADDDWSVRRAVVRALAAAVDDREVREALLTRLGDAVEYVRQSAAVALSPAMGEAEVRAALLARLGDADRSVREAAARTLTAAVGEAEVRNALLAQLGGAATSRSASILLREWPVRRAAAWALAGAVGDAEVRAALLARLGDDDWSVRRAVVRALVGAVGEQEVCAAVLARLPDKNRDVASAAAKVLGAGIVAEKFGLPAGEIDAVYP
jgi:HEAT repeats